MIHFQIAETLSIQPDSGLQSGELFIQAAQAALDAGAETPAGDLTILLTGDEEIRSLNNQYLQIDEPTDVLSFPAGYTDPDTDTPYLGDVIISLPRAQEQASKGEHTLEQELQLLVVHGVLHLLGFDHLEEADQNEMWAVQAEALAQLNNPLSPP
jgi:probable rRNA maturation factor